MALEWLVYGLAAWSIVQLIALWLVITFHQQIALFLWRHVFKDLMWLSFAEAAENQQEEAGGDMDALGMAGQMGALFGNEGSGGLLENAPQLLKMLNELDGADLGGGDGGPDLGGGGSSSNNWRDT